MRLDAPLIGIFDSDINTSGVSTGGAIDLGLQALPTDVTIIGSNLIADPPAIGGSLRIDGSSIGISGGIRGTILMLLRALRWAAADRLELHQCSQYRQWGHRSARTFRHQCLPDRSAPSRHPGQRRQDRDHRWPDSVASPHACAWADSYPHARPDSHSVRRPHQGPLPLPFPLPPQRRPPLRCPRQHRRRVQRPIPAPRRRQSLLETGLACSIADQSAAHHGSGGDPVSGCVSALAVGRGVGRDRGTADSHHPGDQFLPLHRGAGPGAGGAE